MSTSFALNQVFGPLMHSRDVQAALRYPSPDALRVARKQGRLELEMFSLPGRRGLFARTEDVAKLLEEALCRKEQAM